jgi:uncharacterized protein GlcG (DUF336 family)
LFSDWSPHLLSVCDGRPIKQQYDEPMEAIMPNIFESLNLEDARCMIDAGLVRAEAVGVRCSIAVVDAGGNLLAFLRQDGAMTGSVELAINKAYSARIFNNTTDALGKLAQPGVELFGIQHSHAGRVVAFGGGIAVRYNGSVVGAVGVSGGSVQQDIDIADMAQVAVCGSKADRHD